MSESVQLTQEQQDQLRDSIAIAAMNGAIAFSGADAVNPDMLASWAYGIAEAMLKARIKHK